MTANNGSYIPLSECIDGHLYRIQSRNLAFGVFKKSDNGFVGIREKFDSHFLFTEYHWDQGPPFGTVQPVEDLGPCPITELREHLGTVCTAHQRPAFYDETRPNVKPETTHPGTWVHVDDKSPLALSEKDHPRAVANTELFEWLQQQEQKHAYQSP